MHAKEITGDSGQAAVETALVLPLMVFFCLGVVQLTLMQHARLFTEYAAFNAARAGSVWNGNNERMRDAAIQSILPTMARTDGLDQLASAFDRFQELDSAFAKIDWGTPVPDNVAPGVNILGVVRVDTITPGAATLAGVADVRDGKDWRELDFDGPDGWEIVGGSEEDAEDDAAAKARQAYRRATVLSIRVRYWYELRIPFANWVLFVAWYAANADVALRGAIEAPTTEGSANVTNRATDVDSLRDQAPALLHDAGFPTATAREMTVLWDISKGELPLPGSAPRRYFIPLSATYSMRMQSNFHRKWLMHF